MRVIVREIPVSGREHSFRIYPIGDMHIGARACDEQKLRRVVEQIASDDDAYWIGMGDVCDYINRSDPRFNVEALAGWVRMRDLADLASAQSKRALSILSPIAHKCLALVKGNHELAIHKHYERDVYSELVTGIKEASGLDEIERLGLGYSGWLLARFKSEHHTSIFRFSLHHGFVGGRLAGAKALNMQRWLWTHDCDVAVFGHSHNTMIQSESIETVNRRSGKIAHLTRWGCFSGSFLATNVEGSETYSEVKGYFPLPTTGVVIHVTPMRGNDGRAGVQNDRLKVTTR